MAPSTGNPLRALAQATPDMRCGLPVLLAAVPPRGAAVTGLSHKQGHCDREPQCEVSAACLYAARFLLGATHAEWHFWKGASRDWVEIK